MATVISPVADICLSAKRAAKALARVDTETKNAALEEIAVALGERAEEILEANALDMQAGREANLGDALLDRLLLDEARIAQIARAVRQIVALGDPVGEVIDGHRLPNGLDVRKVRVPLGVVAVVYEARPNVTIDAAALCLKSGNAIVLRGSSSALHSNEALARIASEAAVAGGLPQGCVSLVAGGGREELAELATQKGAVDLIIPRGGEGLKAALEEVPRLR
jgi:glutamate-5-semialdehyde dehydrogenase